MLRIGKDQKQLNVKLTADEKEALEKELTDFEEDVLPKVSKILKIEELGEEKSKKRRSTVYEGFKRKMSIFPRGQRSSWTGADETMSVEEFAEILRRIVQVVILLGRRDPLWINDSGDLGWFQVIGISTIKNTGKCKCEKKGNVVLLSVYFTFDSLVCYSRIKPRFVSCGFTLSGNGSTTFEGTEFFISVEVNKTLQAEISNAGISHWGHITWKWSGDNRFSNSAKYYLKTFGRSRVNHFIASNAKAAVMATALLLLNYYNIFIARAHVIKLEKENLITTTAQEKAKGLKESLPVATDTKVPAQRGVPIKKVDAVETGLTIDRASGLDKASGFTDKEKPKRIKAGMAVIEPLTDVEHEFSKPQDKHKKSAVFDTKYITEERRKSKFDRGYKVSPSDEISPEKERRKSKADLEYRSSEKETSLSSERRQSRVDRDRKQSSVDRERKQSSVDRERKQSSVDRERKQSRIEKDRKQSSVDRDRRKSRIEKDRRQSSVEKDSRQSNVDRDRKQSSVDRERKKSRVDKDRRKSRFEGEEEQ